jgi:penicillin-binding protein 1C
MRSTRIVLNQLWRVRFYPSVRLGVAMVVLFAAGYYALPFSMPYPRQLATPIEPSADFRDRTGKPLYHALSEGQRRGEPVTSGELPEHLIGATLCAEDRRFWKHGGIDFIAIVRATRDGVSQREVVSGASTISQQLVKITSPPAARHAGTKIREMLMARRLEMSWSKERILSEYLSRLDYGNLRVGIRAASWGYFGKPVADLSVAEGAFLVGLPQAPTRLNPYVSFDLAKNRQEWVLGQMVRHGYIDEEAHGRAVKQSIVLGAADRSFETPHLVTMISARRQEPGLTSGVLMTTIDLSLQHRVEGIVKSELRKLKGRNGNHAGVVVIDNASGGLLSLVGSPDFFDEESGQVNGTLARRSPGSALKPFTYLMALQNGDSPGTIVADVPTEFGGGGTYRPMNYDHQFYGPMTYREALGNSLNVSAVKVLKRHGGAPALVKSLQRFGLTTLDQPVAKYGLGLTIGGAEVCLLELTNAYACLGRLGEFRPIRFMRDDAEEPAIRLYDTTSCYLLADMLADGKARGRTFGMISVLDLPFPVACKTGTSTNYRDNWTFGYTPEFTVGVWVGNFDSTPMRWVSGVSGAGPIFRRIFEDLHRSYGTTWYEQPEDVVEAWIDFRNGRRVEGESMARTVPDLSAFMRKERFQEYRLPPLATREDYDPSGGAKCGSAYAEWIRGQDNWLGNALVVDAAMEERRAPLIASPAAGTTLVLDPDLPEGGSRLPLRGNGGGGIRWESQTLEISSDREPTATLKPGRHWIHAVDEETGRRDRVWIVVEDI